MKPRKSESKSLPQVKEQTRSRFQIVKLEERIAPGCHYNPQGNQVGCNNGHGFGPH